MYAGDLARIIKLTIENNITESFNIAYPENQSINDLAEKALGSLKKNIILSIRIQI